jgi:hypothetical protein
MADAPDIWHAASRKEVMDMLGVLWRTLDPGDRDRLAEVLIGGPPDRLFKDLDEPERQSSRDRRIFDRLIVLERVGEPPLTPTLQAAMDDIRARYPHWRAQEGERAFFSTWFESRWGPDTNFSVDDLAALAKPDLVDRLRSDMDHRGGLLDSWRQLAHAQPEAALDVLKSFAASADSGPADVWEAGLRGLRDAEHVASIADELLSLLADVPASLFARPEFVRGAADLLEAQSRNLEMHQKPQVFWRLFDRALAAAGAEPPAEHAPDDGPGALDWVTDAINCSMGILATAFINAIYALRPRQGATLGDLSARADTLMSPGKVEHRPARVIGASRISYLFAVDPKWSTRKLLPSFAWKDEEEAMAMWQGYAWQMRIDPQLWAALKPHFLPLFEGERLNRLGDAARNVAQALMLVGIAFGADEFKRDDIRRAIKAMPERVREEAASWIADYMAAGDADNANQDEDPIDGTPDLRWEERIWPWIRKIWPTEPGFQTADVAQHFAMAAIATDKAYPKAVEAIKPYAVPGRSYRLIQSLAASIHPEVHPASTLELVDAFLAPDQMLLLDEAFADIIQRVGASAPHLRDDNRYRRWTDFLARADR